jgi:hypothetical protein
MFGGCLALYIPELAKLIIHLKQVAYKSRANAGTSLGLLIIPSSISAWCREANLHDRQAAAIRLAQTTYCSSGVKGGLWCLRLGGH